MDWQAGAAALLGFIGGLVTGLLKLVMPAYMDLYQENRELREKLRTMEDAVRDMEDAEDWRVREP